MTQPFSIRQRARWADMDFNQHMSNAAFLGCAGQCRMEFLDANGWPMSQFVAMRLGPVVLEDRLTYQREISLLQEFSVELWLAAATDDLRRIQLRNRFVLGDGTQCASVDSVVLWLDLSKRKPVVPPDALREVWLRLPRTQDFTAW